MKLIIQPFFSQQNKETGLFRLMTCGACKQLDFIAQKAQQELGWEVTAMLPFSYQCENSQHPFPCYVRRTYIPNSNPVQQIHWDTTELQRVYSNYDIAISNHELLPTALRVVTP